MLVIKCQAWVLPNKMFNDYLQNLFISWLLKACVFFHSLCFWTLNVWSNMGKEWRWHSTSSYYNNSYQIELKRPEQFGNLKIWFDLVMNLPNSDFVWYEELGLLIYLKNMKRKSPNSSQKDLQFDLKNMQYFLQFVLFSHSNKQNMNASEICNRLCNFQKILIFPKKFPFATKNMQFPPKNLQ